ncbi:hypothetical protein M408DRAFT_24317 [Serendipita vermifera MAFF 305830]|uniref:HbrB-domain-containing protein n=1 Tax=Serendipita vermifera MAFF 305830 TaxID=933852 RepID=A0A0C2XEW1_SERVB|nr:hypothetical protein M408DRAFT_24317 [Serendipita vermifera MAFF 305830]
MRSHSRSDSGLASGAASPLPPHKHLPGSSSSATVRAPYPGPALLGSYGSGVSLVSSSGSTVGGSTVGIEKDNTMGALHVHVLPLFNRDPLKIPIEDLNSLVKRHMAAVISRSPSKAVSQLESDVTELITAGMVTLNSKLAAGVEEEKLAGRIVDLWGFFWDQVLPYVEGVFLPLQTDLILSSLTRTSKSNTASALHNELGTTPVTLSGGPSIDVRKLALRAFRDSIVLPVAPRLQKRFSSASRDKDLNSELADHHRPRLEQMLLVLSSIATYTVSLASTTENTQPTTPGERAITTLLRLVLYPPGTHPTVVGAPGPRLPSFLSGGAPRDRRGRLARKSLQIQSKGLSGDLDDRLATGGLLSAETLGTGGGTGGSELGLRDDNTDRERERRELIESLRSPNLELSTENGEHGPDLEDGDEGTMGGTVMPGDPMESLGTGPGGWGASMSGGTGGTARPAGVASAMDHGGANRRAAVYDDEVYDDGNVAQYASAIPAAQPRRPSRSGDGDRETQAGPPERKLRI